MVKAKLALGFAHQGPDAWNLFEKRETHRSGIRLLLLLLLFAVTGHKERTIPPTNWKSWPRAHSPIRGAPTSQVGSALPHQLKWPIALQIVAGRAVSLVGEPPTETYRPDEWSGANRGRAHRANLCRPALEVRRLRTAPDGWNCCCNCCCHGEMRCGVDTSAGQPCATAPRE